MPTRGDPALAWIDGQATPGRRAFALSAALEVAATAALVAQWAFLGVAVARMLGGGPALLPLLGVAAAAPLRLTLRLGAARLAAAGRRKVTSATRAALVPSLVAGAGRLTGSEAADTLLERPPTVARYLAGALPLRRAAVPSTLLILAAVAVVHWPVAVLLALCTALLPLNLRLAGQATLTAGERQLDAMRRLSAVIRETVSGMPTLRSLRATTRRRATLERSSRRLGRASRRVLAYAFLSGAVMDVAVTFAIAVSATYTGLVLLGYLTLPGAPALGLGGALFVLLLCPAYFVPAQRAARGFHDRDDALVAARALLAAVQGGAGALGVADERRPSPHSVPPDPANREAGSPGASPPQAATPPAPFVRLDGVSLVDGDALILGELSLTAEPGRWTAVAGPSGAGKTTLLQLAAGRLAPSAGSVTWDGADTPPPFGWLGSRTVILGGTLAENIGLRHPEVGESAMRAAAEAAGLGALLEELPHGLDTVLGTLGRELSAGERRRVAVARLIAADRALWILDEPTAHLDADTERQILATLREASRGRTVLVATHSGAVLGAADAAHELRGGALVSERVRQP